MNPIDRYGIETSRLLKALPEMPTNADGWIRYNTILEKCPWQFDGGNQCSTALYILVKNELLLEEAKIYGDEPDRPFVIDLAYKLTLKGLFMSFYLKKNWSP